MAKENVILSGLDIENNQKWYCNRVVDDIAKCCDTYDKDGSHIQRIEHYIITGKENWKYNPISKCYYFFADNKYYDDNDGGRLDPMLCTHFRWSNDIVNTPLYMFSGGRKNEIQFNYDNGVGGVENFVNWIKEQLNTKIPMQVCYVLMYPYYYEPNLHKRTTVQVMRGLAESLKNFDKN